MTRIFTDGAEMGDILFWTTGAAITATNRTGSYGYNISSATKQINPISELYLRYAWLAQTYVDGGIWMRFMKGATTLCDVYVQTDGKLYGRVNGINVANTTNLYVPSSWNLTEVHLKIDDSPNGIFELKLNGILEFSYNGDTKPGSDADIDCIGPNIASARIFDDLALNDTNGTVDNSWCGDGRISRIYPSGSGTTNNWTNSGGVSASANYLYVDEVPHDTETTYVYTLGDVPGTQDIYNMSTFSLPQGAQIKHLYPETRARKTSSGSYAYGIKLGYLPSGGSAEISGSILLSMTYGRCVGTSASANPVSGSPFTQADIDAIQYVCEVA